MQAFFPKIPGIGIDVEPDMAADHLRLHLLGMALDIVPALGGMGIRPADTGGNGDIDFFTMSIMSAGNGGSTSASRRAAALPPSHGGVRPVRMK